MKLKFTPQANRRRGAALVEYGLLIAGVSLISSAAVAVFGHKTNDLLGTVAGVLPSSNEADAVAIESGRLFNTTQGANGGLTLDMQQGPQTTSDVFGNGAGDLIIDGQTGSSGL